VSLLWNLEHGQNWKVNGQLQTVWFDSGHGSLVGGTLAMRPVFLLFGYSRKYASSLKQQQQRCGPLGQVEKI
jgi:hypothetical protein